MDRDYRKEGWYKTTKLKIAIVLFVFSIIVTCGNIQAAEKDKKIELEKEEIIGVLERPNVIFPIRWKDPDGPNEREYKLQRSFKEEIFDFVDMDSMKKGVRGQGGKGSSTLNPSNP